MLNDWRFWIAILIAAFVGAAGATSFFLHQNNKSADQCILNHVKPGISNLAARRVSISCHKLYPSTAPPRHEYGTINPFDKFDTKTVPKVSRPTNSNDTEAWQKYLSQVLGQHLQGMTASRPYPYLIPAGSSSTAKAGRRRQLDNITGVVLRGVTPGNLLAFAGPSSTDTADLVIKAFKDVAPGSMKGVIVLFIGDQAGKARVGAVVKPTGAEYRFVAL